MCDNDYSYRGLKASTWDLSRGDTSNWSDRAFYLDIVRNFGQPVLDVGCGTGRILLDFLGQGIDIDGVDDSPEMLALCREKAQPLGVRVTLHQLKMQSLALPRRYGTVLVPSSTFQLLTDLDDAREAMRRFHAHLLPGGAFVTAFGFDWRPGEALDTGWTQNFNKIRPEDGGAVRGWGRTWYDPPHQLWHGEERFEVHLAGRLVASETVRRFPAGRWYSQPQAIELLHRAGFGEIQLYRGFSFEPATPKDRLFCVLARP